MLFFWGDICRFAEMPTWDNEKKEGQTVKNGKQTTNSQRA